MSRFLDTTGNTIIAVAICDRCGRKFPYVDLKPDRDNPGMLVCDNDNDELDPYKLPQRKAETITLRRPRPEKDK